jgi:hypothetical protein
MKLLKMSSLPLLNYFLVLKSYLHFIVKDWNWVHRTLASQCRHTSRQCPKAIILPVIHYRPANLTRIYHGNFCQWYCSTSHGQWSSHCLRETANLLCTCIVQSNRFRVVGVVSVGRVIWRNISAYTVETGHFDWCQSGDVSPVAKLGYVQ